MTLWPTIEELPPLDADELGVWLSMTGWATKARVVGLIGSRVGGDWWTAEQVAKPLGLTVAYTSRLLAQLERDLVLWRDGGSGGRLFWVEVNPRVGQWRGVEWTVSRHERQGVIALWRESTELKPEWRLNARPCGARRANPVARFKSARTAARDGSTSRAPASRDVEGGPGTGSRAPKSARRGGTVVDLLDRRAFGAAAQEVSPTGVGDPNSPPPGPAGAGEVDSFVVALVAGEITRRARPGPGGRRFMADSKRALVAQLVARYGEAVTLEALERVPDEGQQVPSLIDDLAVTLARGNLVAAEPARDIEAERAQLLTRRERCTERLATYEELGEDELAAICRTELEACETSLAALGHTQEDVAL